MNDRLSEAITRLRGADQPESSLGGAAAASDLERRYAIRLPDDFRAYLSDHSTVEDWMDDRGFIWWAAGGIKSLLDECGAETPSDQRNETIEEEAAFYIVFADFLSWCYAYAICCSEGPNRGRIAMIGGGRDCFVAEGFTEFLILAARDSVVLHGGSEVPRGTC
jgi:hypothetical protein